MGKARFYKFYISISCGITHEIKREYFKERYYSKDTCDLNYTTADCDFFYESLREDHYDTGIYEKHLRLINPTVKELNDSIDEGIEYLNCFVKEDTFNGGNIIFIFSGHGSKDTGNLLLKDNSFSAKDLLKGVLRKRLKNEDRLRVDIILDSCFSGAFLIRLIEEVWNNFEKDIFLCNAWSSSSFDEVSYEYPKYKHGLFTYVWKSKQEVVEKVKGKLHLLMDYQDKLKPVEELFYNMQNPIEYINGTLSKGNELISVVELNDITFEIITNKLKKNHVKRHQTD